MTAHAFGIALLVGSALLAFWILWKYTTFGPKTMLWAVLHAVIACVLLRSVPFLFEHVPAQDMRPLALLEIFGVALPALVYAFLSGGWVTRIAVGMLRP